MANVAREQICDTASPYVIRCMHMDPASMLDRSGILSTMYELWTEADGFFRPVRTDRTHRHPGAGRQCLWRHHSCQGRGTIATQESHPRRGVCHPGPDG